MTQRFVDKAQRYPTRAAARAGVAGTLAFIGASLVAGSAAELCFRALTGAWLMPDLFGAIVAGSASVGSLVGFVVAGVVLKRAIAPTLAAISVGSTLASWVERLAMSAFWSWKQKSQP